MKTKAKVQAGEDTQQRPGDHGLEGHLPAPRASLPLRFHLEFAAVGVKAGVGEELQNGSSSPKND